MPNFPFSQLFTANQQGFNPFAGWQYEYAPYPCAVKVLVRSSTTGNRMALFAGSETIVERTPVQGGGTAGVTPAELTTPPVIFHAAQGDRLKALIDEVLGGTPTVDGLIILDPLM